MPGAAAASLRLRRLPGDTETPVSAWLKLATPGRGDFLLESVEGGRVRGRYSFLGLQPDRILAVRGRQVVRHHPGSGRPPEVLLSDPLAALRAELAAIAMPLPGGVPASLPLLVGHFGYGAVRLVERLPEPRADPLDLPDMMFVRPAVVLVFDRLTDELFLVAPVWPGQEAGLAEARLAETALRLRRPVPEPEVVPNALPAPEPEAVVPDEAYHAMVARARAFIAAGDIFQVVLARRFLAPFPLSPFALYRALRRVNPSPFLFHLDLPGHAVIGSSPEILVRVRAGEVTIRPIAGTRPRAATEAEDAARAADLLADPKERAEHLMLLDLGRNDVGRVAEAGTVRVTEAFAIERYSHVMHIVSSVSGRLQAGRDAVDALFAGFPAGTVSGAPKVRAMEIIAELEPEARGIYAGGVGYFAPDGSMDSCIVLRTAVVKDGVMHVTAGAGIVADSVPEAEAAECRAKAGALFAAARAAVREATGAHGADAGRAPETESAAV